MVDMQDENVLAISMWNDRETDVNFLMAKDRNVLKSWQGARYSQLESFKFYQLLKPEKILAVSKPE